MNVSIHSPLQSEVLLSSLAYSLSPPPTPIAKRANHRRFFPSNAATPVTPTPTFFPKSKSLINDARHRPSPSPSTADKEAMERKSLALLASRPVPRLHLTPRPKRFGTNLTNLSSQANGNNIRKQVRANELPPLPFSFPDSVVEQLTMPSLSDDASSPRIFVPVSTRSLPTPKSIPTPKRPVESSSAGGRQAKKLPPFQQGGMHRRTVKRCNSFAARSA